MELFPLDASPQTPRRPTGVPSTSIEGTLTTISDRSGTHFYVIEATSGRLIACQFSSSAAAEQAANCWHDRVVVTGLLQPDRTSSQPATIDVERIHRVACQSEWDTAWEWDTKLD